MSDRIPMWTVHISFALFAGFMIGAFTARRQQQTNAKHLARQQSSRGSKRKPQERQSTGGTGRLVASANALGGTDGTTPQKHSAGDLELERKGSRRSRKRERNKRLCPKDVALDAFANAARSNLSCIGAGDYQSLLFLPRATFLSNERFVPYATCFDQLVSLGRARSAAAGVDQLRILYISCSWANTVGAEGVEEDYETARAFLERNVIFQYVYVGRSCVASDLRKATRATQLRHVPLALLRADALLLLPRRTSAHRCCEGKVEVSHSDFNFHTRGAWSRLELAVAAVGQAKVYVAFRAEPFPEATLELKAGITAVRDLTRQAADTLVASASGTHFKSSADNEAEKDAKGEAAKAASILKAACKNWLGAELDPLASLEKARLLVAAAEKSAGVGLLNAIQGMQSIPMTSTSEDLRKSLGDEHVDGEKELAMSLLLFTVYCAQPKERATYTDNFLGDAGKMEISYRPIAVVRSPYRERFGTPRQPQVTAAVLHGGALEGRIVFLKGRGYEEALQDLSGFEMIWVITHMHLNKGWNSKVRPPRLPEGRKGLFSTRSPHRPNALALSSLRVSQVDPEEGIIYVQGLDLLDGTPVLDIKPYIGYCDAFPNVKAGWLDALGSGHEEQGDFLPKFSVGAALVHTAGTESPPSEPVHVDGE